LSPSFAPDFKRRFMVIYHRPMSQQWLDRDYASSPVNLTAALRPWPAEYMEGWDVSTLVNAPENDMLECIRPVGGDLPSRRQLSLL
jgi:putative SOS response-associated peptidase YedK